LPSERPRLRFQDVIDNAEAIERYIKGLDQTAFRANDLVVDAVERCLSRISEAANKLGGLAEELAPNQPWAKIRGLGNLLRHEYDIIRRDDLWAIVHDDLSSLRADCVEAIEALERRGDQPDD
jgi:uncharacterized protein with HEPN domain